MALLTVSGIFVEEEGNAILTDISFTQSIHQKVVLAGETGSGKSTLMQTIAGLVQPAKGEVLFEKDRVFGPHEVLVPGHPEIAYLSQQFELPQFLRVEQVLKYANTLTDEEAKSLYEVCRITHLLKRRTNQLSGGERQRIALARLLSSWPTLLLLDEPFSNLDMGHKQVLKAVIHDIGEELGISCMLISHDPLDTLSWADNILVLKNGKLVQEGSPASIYRQPANEYVASLFGNYNLIPASKADAFSKTFGLGTVNESIIVRPENFILGQTEFTPAICKIDQVRYFGSYTELVIKVAGSKVTVKTSLHHFHPGQEIILSINPENISTLINTQK